ncbi:methyltransferase [Streptomyces sp. NRRL WC-3618]|jgi:SAM-dependent methyltransferase|uniref:methyltransferase n=1 Tax=unclassified Streptomyces TaxID=2593676 RepID=UPI0006AD84B7|nr:methyltransferase [Streptomyces sp. NRRL WC-3618]KOV88133.1 methyltransferase [Streptomyces sp. NRRL WC-3618]
MTQTIPDVSTPAGIIRLGNMFCDAKALLTAVELRLFTVLHEKGPATEEEIRAALELHGRGLSDFLSLLTALGLLERENGTYRNSTGADTYLVHGTKSYVGGFLERSNRNLYPAWGRLSEGLRTGKPQSGSDFETVTQNQHILRQFVGMMDALTHVVGPELAQKYDWSGHTSVLDVGGARGNLCSIIVKHHPHLTGNVFDLPPMEPLFDERVAEDGLTGQITFHGGSFFNDPLPHADVVVLGHVLHDWDKEQRAALIAKAYDAVNPGGTLLMYDRMLEDESTHIENLVISLDMLLVTDGGEEYPTSEAVAVAKQVGFASVEVSTLSEYDTLVVCRKKA